MRVRLELPELMEFSSGFPAHWMNIIFTRNRPDTYQVHTIITTYVRLVEAAMAEYRQARLFVHAFWNHHGSLQIGAHNMAGAYFEACLTNMHRAVRCLIKIRSRRDVPEDLKRLIPEKPRFTEDRIASRIRDVRDAVQHLEDQVLDGTVPEKTPFMIQAVGSETPILEEPGQSLKTIDRLQIGSFEIMFSELCSWLKEMGQYAELISRYERSNDDNIDALTPT
jgi:hypothetical protein